MWRLPLGLCRVGDQQLEEMDLSLLGCQADKASHRWQFQYCVWATLLCRQRLPFGPVFQDYTQKAFSFHHVPELFPSQYNAAVRSLWTGQHFSQCFNDAAHSCPNRAQIQSGASSLGILPTREQASWPVTPTPPALSVVGLCLPGPLSCSWLSNMHPLTLNVSLLPTQTGLFVCADRRDSGTV